MAINKISEFPKVTPSADDKILIEKNGEGGHINLSEMPVSTPVNTKITSEVDTLNLRIDNIMASSGDDISEIVDARQGSDRTNYASLKARLDAENNQLKGDITEIDTLKREVIDFNSNIIYSHTIGVDEVEIGSLDGNGILDRTDRTRTKTFYRVHKGDVVKLSKVKQTGAYGVNIWFYNFDKTLKSVSQWYQFGSNIFEIPIEEDGYVKFHSGIGNTESLTDLVTIIYANNRKRIDDLHDLSTIDSVEPLTVKPVDSWKYGSLINGVEAYSDIRLVSKSFYKVRKGDLIVPMADVKDFTYGLNEFGKDYSFIQTYGYFVNPFTVQHDGYVRIIVKRADNGTISDVSAFENCVGIVSCGGNIERNYIIGASDTRVYTSKVSELAIGSYIDGGVDSRTDRMRLTTSIRVKKGDVVRLNYRGVGMVVRETGLNNEIISYSPWKYQNYHFGDKFLGDYIVQNDGYIDCHFSIIDPTTYQGYKDIREMIKDYDGLITVVHPISTNGDLSAYNPPKKLYRKARRIKGVSVTQDGCMIDGNLWLFSDGVSSYGDIRIINPVNGSVISTKKHNLGHANCISYNENNDTLVTYGTDGDNKPTIVIYKNPKEKEMLSKADEDCMVIPLYKNGEFMNVTASLCWGEDEQTIYYMEGCCDTVETLATFTIDSDYDLFKIQLGLGSNDFSSDGWGNFVSGKASDEYNGTCKIIKTYHGEIRNGSDVCVSGNDLSTAQGMEYDGYIYLGWGTVGHNFVVMELNEDTDSYRVIDNYRHREYDNNHNEVFFEPEVLALNGNKIICGSASKNNGSLLLEFDR